MARMVDLIRAGSAPSAIMRRAAQGALSLPPSEAIEILVALAGNRELGAEAEQTLWSWNEPSLIEVASDAGTPTEVLLHLLQYHAQRPAVITALCENPRLPLTELEHLAKHAGPDVLRAMTLSARVRASSQLLESMAENPAAETAKAQLDHWASTAQDQEAETIAANFLLGHATEVSAEEGRDFELVASPDGEEDNLAKLMLLAKRGETAEQPEDVAKLSLLQRIGRMRVGERIKLAVRGNREERMVLIRDRSRLVSLAVLESPKVSDTEMEAFASMKNIQESVLRAIATKRKYIKLYGVVKALATNPKTPLDVALPLLSHLLIKELRGLGMNKNVNEAVRKLAVKLFRLKTERKRD
jgi:hypothetical protein